MNKTITTTVAAAIMTLPLLTACGSGAESPPSAPTVSAAPTAGSPTQAPASTAPSAEPSSDPTPEAGQVEAAAKEFVKTGLTIGYPDKSFDVYIDRLKPLMTKRGFADTKKEAEGRANLDTAYAKLYAQRIRSTPRFTSDVTVSSASAAKADAKVDYRVLQQKQTDGKWKTVKTSPEDTAEMKLVNEDGKWLVDELS